MTASDRVVLVATTNPGKKLEIAAVLRSGLRLLTLADLADVHGDVAEDAETFMGNAEKKALYYARLSGLLTLADDSGLEVDALDGRPGVHSARFAGPQRDDAANNTMLIGLLRDTPPHARSARFCCAMVVAEPSAILARAEGHIAGRIIDTPRGRGGFGYDPHFFVPELNCTTAELNPTEKNRVSHRGQALRKIARLLAGAAAATRR